MPPPLLEVLSPPKLRSPRSKSPRKKLTWVASSAEVMTITDQIHKKLRDD